MTQFLTMTSLCGHPTFCIPAGRQKDGHFLSWMRVNIQGKCIFACGLNDIFVQKAISRLIKEQKKRKIMQIFLTKFQFPCAKKPILENTQKICISKNMRFILGDFKSNVCSYFFHFCIRHTNLVFFAIKVR